MATCAVYAILGAPDPEMTAIESLLSTAGIQYGLAHRSGARVKAHEAYARGTKSVPEIPSGTDQVWLVECQPVDLPSSIHTVVIDHHRPGDPGYGRPAEEFLPASSIGQLNDQLADRELLPKDWEELEGATSNQFKLVGGRWGIAHRAIPQQIALAAAADHCLAAAYQGECPGVSPDTLLEWRVSTRASFQGRSVEELQRLVRAAMSRLEQAPQVTIAETMVADLRGSGVIPELPEAAARLGKPFLAELREGNQRKLVLQSAPPQVISTWIEEQKRAGYSPYGDPARGFAGVILPQP